MHNATVALSPHQIPWLWLLHVYSNLLETLFNGLYAQAFRSLKHAQTLHSVSDYYLYLINFSWLVSVDKQNSFPLYSATSSGFPGIKLSYLDFVVSDTMLTCRRMGFDYIVSQAKLRF